MLLSVNCECVNVCVVNVDVNNRMLRMKSTQFKQWLTWWTRACTRFYVNCTRAR